MLAAQEITIPAALEGDGDEVRDALTVASSLWERGDHVSAVTWLRRAAVTAGESGDDGRALALYKVAAELACAGGEEPLGWQSKPCREELEPLGWQSEPRREVVTGVRPIGPPPEVATSRANGSCPANDDGASPSLVALAELYERTGRWAERRPDPDHRTADDLVRLDRRYRAEERWELLVEVYLDRVEASTDVAEQVRLLRETATIVRERLGDAEQAYEVLVTAFELDAGDDDTAAELEQATSALCRWPALVRSVNERLARAADPRVQVALALRLAGWYGGELGRPDYAQALYAKVIALDPYNARALRRLALWMREQGDWRQAGMLLERARLGAASDGAAAAILTELGDLLQHVGDQDDKRIAYYRSALEADGGYLPALAALEALYDERHLTAELVEILGRRADALAGAGAPPQERAAAQVRLRQAILLELTLDRPDEAIDAYRLVIGADPGNVTAMGGLERLYRAQQRWHELYDVLEMRLDAAQTERERIELCLQIAALQHQELVRPDVAARWLEQVVEVDRANLAAFEELARCYGELGRWHDHVDCLRRSVRAATGVGAKIDLCTRVARTYELELRDEDRALDAYRDVALLDGDHTPTLAALARLYARRGRPAQAVACLTRVAELAGDDRERAEAYYAVGKELDGKLGDRTRARARFEEALDADPTHLGALAALAAMAKDAGDWHGAARCLDRQQRHTDAPRERSRLLTEIGRLREERLGESAGAAEDYRLAIELDPDNLDAALGLARRHVADGAFVAAEPVIEALLCELRDPGVRLEVELLYGEVELALGKPERALASYRAAQRIDVSDERAMWGVAEASFRLEDWAGATTGLHYVLAGLPAHDVAGRVRAHHQLGCVKRAEGDPRAAVVELQRALALDDAHRGSLEALAGAYEDLEQWAKACACRQRLLALVTDDDERYRLLRELAALWSERMGEPDQALYVYEQAAESRPHDHELLHRMLPLYHATGQWRRMIEALGAIVATDSKPARRARYLGTMAQVQHEKLGDAESAASLCEEALDLDPAYSGAFERLERIHAGLGDWQALERSCRRMLERAAASGDRARSHELWRRLALVYRDRLGDPEGARAALRAALAIDPDGSGERHMLAELGGESGRVDGALEQYRAILERDPLDAAAYRGMYALHLQGRAYDEAWCCAAALALLGQAAQEERRFFEEWRPTEAPRLAAPLDEQQWSEHLRHPDQDASIGRIFEAVTDAALAARSDLARRREALPTDPIERAFVAGQELAMQRRDHRLASCFSSSSELAILFYAAIQLVMPGAPVPAGLSLPVSATAERLARFLEPRAAEELHYAVSDFTKAGGRGSIKRWRQAVTTTAARAGLLLCGDLQAASSVLAGQPPAPGDLPPRARLADLLRWSVSDSFFALRRELGVDIQARRTATP